MCKSLLTLHTHSSPPSARRAVPRAKSGAGCFSRQNLPQPRSAPALPHAPTAPLHTPRSQVGSPAAIIPTPTSAGAALSNCLGFSLPSRAIWTSSDLVPRGMEEGQQHLGVVSQEESYSLEAGGLCTYMKCSRLPPAPLCLPSPLGMAWTPNGCCIS